MPGSEVEEERDEEVGDCGRVRALFCDFTSAALDAKSASKASASAAQIQSRTEQVSPRIVALRKQLEAGNRGAIKQFWQEVTYQECN
jgi:hypothetical protein